MSLSFFLAAGFFFHTAGSAVHGDLQKVLAFTGSDIILPCSFNRSTADGDFPSVEWSKQNLEPNVVYLYRDGCETFEAKNPQYEYRSSLVTSQLKNGIVSLRLSNVQLSDAGIYKCMLFWKNAPQVGTIVKMVVASVAAPRLSLVPADDGTGGVAVQCDSGCWSPEPSVTFLDPDGNAILAQKPVMQRHPEGCVSIKQRIKLQSVTSSVTCRVDEPKFNQTKETMVLIPADCLRPDNFLLGVTNCATAAAILILVGIVFLFQQKCNICGGKNQMVKQNSTDSTSENQHLFSKSNSVDSIDGLKNDIKRLEKENAQLKQTLQNPKSKMSPVTTQHNRPTIPKTPTSPEAPKFPNGMSSPVLKGCSSPTDSLQPKSGSEASRKQQKTVFQRQNSTSSTHLDGSDPQAPESANVWQGKALKPDIQLPNGSASSKGSHVQFSISPECSGPICERRPGASVPTAEPKSVNAAQGKPSKPGLKRQNSISSVNWTVQSSVGPGSINHSQTPDGPPSTNAPQRKPLKSGLKNHDAIPDLIRTVQSSVGPTPPADRPPPNKVPQKKPPKSGLKSHDSIPSVSRTVQTTIGETPTADGPPPSKGPQKKPPKAAIQKQDSHNNIAPEPAGSAFPINQSTKPVPLPAALPPSAASFQMRSRAKSSPALNCLACPLASSPSAGGSTQNPTGRLRSSTDFANATKGQRNFTSFDQCYNPYSPLANLTEQ